MEEVKVHFWHVILWEFKNNKSTVVTAKKICVTKSETVFKISFWQQIIERWTQMKLLIKPWSRCFERIRGMQSLLKCSIILSHLKKIREHKNLRTRLLEKCHFFYDDAKLHLARIRQEKILDLVGSGLFYPVHHIHQTLPQVISIFCVLYKMLWMTKNFSQDQVKMFVENFLILKPSEFYLRGINKLLDRWQEVFQNVGKYNIDWNLFMN